VLAFHGGEGNPLRLAVQTGFNDIADRNGFAVVYPETTGHQWNDGRSTTAGFGDDVRFVNQLIDHLVSSEHIDPARIYATGPSNGGMFTLRLACETSDRIAAFAVVAASFRIRIISVARPSVPCRSYFSMAARILSSSGRAVRFRTAPRRRRRIGDPGARHRGVLAEKRRVSVQARR
jgi:polyhydroxybutyrate depolymerase